MKKILIIEDNKAEAEALSNVVYKIDSEVKTIKTDNVGKALEYAINNNFSLFIVDIILNPQIKTDASGIEFVETIRQLPQYKYVPVIFVTSLNDPRLYAYENLHCYRYIQKPLLYSDVEPVIQEALDFTHIVENEMPLKLKQDGILYIIQKNEIIYAYSKAAKMTIVTIKEKYGFYYLTCDSLLDMLKSDNFIKCSRNTIVNSRCIRSIDQRKEYIELDGCSDKIKIGRTFKKNFLKEIYEDD